MTDYTTKDSGERVHFESGMQRDSQAGKPRFDLLHPLDVPFEEQFLTRVAMLMSRGAEKYSARNWEQAKGGEELARFKASAERHLQQWIAGEEDEDHAAAVVFNLLGYETIRYKWLRGLQTSVNEALDRLGMITMNNSFGPVVAVPAEGVEVGITDPEYGDIPLGACIQDDDDDWWYPILGDDAGVFVWWRCVDGSRRPSIASIVEAYGICTL